MGLLACLDLGNIGLINFGREFKKIIVRNLYGFGGGKNFLTLLDVGTGGQIKLTTPVKPNVAIGDGCLVDAEVKPRVATQGGGTFLEVTGGGIKPRVPSKS